jgi:hypothetical protein
MAQVVKCLLGKCKTLSTSTNTAKKTKKFFVSMYYAQ